MIKANLTYLKVKLIVDSKIISERDAFKIFYNRTKLESTKE